MFVIVGVYFLFFLTFVYFFERSERSSDTTVCFDGLLVFWLPLLDLNGTLLYLLSLQIIALLWQKCLVFCVFFCCCCYSIWLAEVILKIFSHWFTKGTDHLNSCSDWLQRTLAKNSWARWVHVQELSVAGWRIFLEHLSQVSLFAFYYSVGNIIDHRKMLTELLKLLKLLWWHTDERAIRN